MGRTKEKMFCPECGMTKNIGEFYSSKNKEKYPKGKLPICKNCRTLMVNNWEKETFIDILEECDVPFIAKDWNNILDAKMAEGPEACGPLSVLGRYLATMQLTQHKNDRFADSERCQLEVEQDIEETMIAQGYDEETIEQAKIDSRKIRPFPGFDNMGNTAAFQVPPPQKAKAAEINQDGTVTNPELLPDYFASEDDINYDNELTDDDKKYLRLKWGKTYNSEELVRLEKLYIEMEESFDIQNAGHKDTLIKVCKTSLKSEQLLDIGDVESSQKMIRMYETLMKAGKFTAVQNKTEQGECLDSISELVLMCEKQGFIPRFYIDKPNDKVDETIMDMKEYTRDLIKGESNLEAMIEQAVKSMYDQENREEDEDLEDDEIILDEIEAQIQDKDFIDFNEFVEQNEEMSEEAIKNYLKGSD